MYTPDISNAGLIAVAMNGIATALAVGGLLSFRSGKRLAISNYDLPVEKHTRGAPMRHRLLIILSIAGLVCNIAATALAAAAIYVNQTTVDTLATATWESSDFFKEALLAQSKYAILCVMALCFGAALQMASELVRHQPRPHDHAVALDMRPPLESVGDQRREEN
jgi:hypothetical protein